MVFLNHLVTDAARPVFQTLLNKLQRTLLFTFIATVKQVNEQVAV